MALHLTALPSVVAREVQMLGGGHEWAWSLSDDEKTTLRTMVQNGAAGTAQRRRGSELVLLAWDVSAQREAVKAIAEARRQEQRNEGRARVVYREPAKAVGMRTYFPYAYEPAAW